MTLTIWGVVVAILAVLAGMWRAARGVRRATEDRIGRASAEDALAAERERNKLDADIDEDPDLADRARRAGLVRPEPSGGQ